jgi:hypothetical protein
MSPAGHSAEAVPVSGIGVSHELVGEWVKVTGKHGIYVVLRADAATGTADVLLISGVRQIESGVPLGLLHSLREGERQNRLKDLKLPAAG